MRSYTGSTAVADDVHVTPLCSLRIINCCMLYVYADQSNWIADRWLYVLKRCVVSRGCWRRDRSVAVRLRPPRQQLVLARRADVTGRAWRMRSERVRWAASDRYWVPLICRSSLSLNEKWLFSYSRGKASRSSSLKPESACFSGRPGLRVVVSLRLQDRFGQQNLGQTRERKKEYRNG